MLGFGLYMRLTDFTKQSQPQLELSWRDEDALRSELESRTGMALDIAITNNGSSMLSLRRGGKGAPLCLRLHHMFLSADPSVIAAVAEWVKHPKGQRQGEILDRFIRGHGHLIQKKSPRRAALCAHGRRHDLQAFYQEVNQASFNGAVEASITWGRDAGPGQRRSIRFGAYFEQARLIRIHPALDQEFVPAFFVRYIVFHEMLHAYLGVKKSPSGRRRIHPPEFKCMERAYPDFARALAWQSDPAHLRRLLR